MAILAGGVNTGVAPKADLYLLKVKGNYHHTDNLENHSKSFHTVRSCQYWSNHVQNHIEERKNARRQNGGPEVKSVINMSWGKNGPILYRNGKLTLHRSQYQPFVFQI
jgi:hypothetical protein